jgi:hypothetical protein
MFLREKVRANFLMVTSSQIGFVMIQVVASQVIRIKLIRLATLRYRWFQGC